MPIITIYRTFYDQTPYYIEIDKALERIKYGKSAGLVEKIRCALPGRANDIKKQLPCILFAGRFNKRAISGLENHSGYICLDFDKFSDLDTMHFWRDTLEGDIYTYSIFTSPSGMGLKQLVKIPETDYKGHKAYFKGLEQYYSGCPYFDKTVFDVSRICFESYDTEVSINHGSELWTGQIFDPEPVKVEYNQASLDEQETVRRLLKWADRKYPIVAGARNSNLFRLCASFNDFGINYDYALSVCSQFQTDDFKLKEIETTLKSAYRKTSKHGLLKF